MSSLKSLPKPFDTDMCVPLGRGHGCVTEELLNNSHIGTAFEDVSGRRMSKRVRRQAVAGNCLS